MSSRKSYIKLNEIKRVLIGEILIPINIIIKHTIRPFLFLKHNIKTAKHNANIVLRACVKKLNEHSGSRHTKESALMYKLFFLIMWCREKTAAGTVR